MGEELSVSDLYFFRSLFAQQWKYVGNVRCSKHFYNKANLN